MVVSARILSWRGRQLVAVGAIAGVLTLSACSGSPSSSSGDDVAEAAGPSSEAPVETAAEKARPKTTAAGTAKQGGALEFVYAVTLADPAGLAAAAADLNRQDGVQGVELKAD